jgi:hypothetical protein
MLTESGHAQLTTQQGAEFSFTPSLGRIATLGSPHEIVACFHALHGPHAAQEAAYVLACLCDQEDASPLIGWWDEDGWHEGAMPPAERVILARHLMHHGIVGKASPEADSGQGRGREGKYSETFDASEFVSAARVHLGLSSADAEALSMTEWHQMMELKFPDTKKRERNVASRPEYEALMARIKGKRGD